MGWYDVFSRFYDRSLETLYADARLAAGEALELRAGHRVLDLPCGTGLSFDVLASGVGGEGVVVGADRSQGMLRQARRRIEARGWPNVHAIELDAYQASRASITDHVGDGGPERVLVFLGFTAMPQYETAFAALWELLAEGGRMVVVDVHASRPGLQGTMVNLVARADISRPAWEPLEAVAEGFSRHELPPRRQYGGALYVAMGTKPLAGS